MSYSMYAGRPEMRRLYDECMAKYEAQREREYSEAKERVRDHVNYPMTEQGEFVEKGPKYTKEEDPDGQYANETITRYREPTESEIRAMKEYGYDNKYTWS